MKGSNKKKLECVNFHTYFFLFDPFTNFVNRPWLAVFLRVDIVTSQVQVESPSPKSKVKTLGLGLYSAVPPKNSIQVCDKVESNSSI